MKARKGLRYGETVPRYETSIPLALRLDPIKAALGQCVISFDYDDTALVLDLCMSQGILFRNQRVVQKSDGKRRTLICISVPSLSRLLRAAERSGYDGLTLVIEREYGVAFFLRRYRYRFGAFIGFLLMWVIILLSGSVLWDIRITGNTGVSDARIREELSAVGFEIGSSLADVDTDEIENRLLMTSDDIAWMSINLRGTVAHVEVVEKKQKPEKPPSSPANLVAAKNGLIVSMEIYSGLSVVQVGDIVTKGELLVSGIYDSASVGYRLRSASGSVFARTEDTIIIDVPFVYEEKVYTGRCFEEKSLKIFGKTIKISKNSRNLPTLCDKICTVDNLSVISGIPLPFELEKTCYKEYRYDQMTRCNEAAVAIAFDELDGRLAALGDSVALLRKSVTTEITDEGVRLTARLVLLEDIARRQEFEFTKFPSTG